MDKQFYNPEIWGGIECTINRHKDQYFDQLEYSGHYNREGDLQAIASLGISKLRYPILWEKHQPQKEAPINWTGTEKKLEELRTLGIEVIAGLVHHGSGPAYTDLLDPSFPQLLADYAGEVARQFPWIEYYTPVNEPLTTARFSGLYGIWYPHHNAELSFLTMLIHELKGTVLAMKAIWKVNPSAKLVQTEDLGKTYSTPALAYQANFENERRWLTYDLLCGKVNRHHPLWSYILKKGVARTELEFFLDNPCPPDVFGFNHYLTSERFIDERLHYYPAHTHGGNVRHRYADVEAVRVELEEPSGIAVLVEEAWKRYRKPIAITEVHLHCHREEQLRWFKYVWDAVCKLKAKGVDIKGVTSWALLGSFGWNKLLTTPGGDYEPGAFDLRGGTLRPTALAHFISRLNKEDNCEHHLSAEKGWWQRPSRVLYGPIIKDINTTMKKRKAPLLIIGKNGTLGKAFARVCEQRCIPYQLISRQDCDISQPGAVASLIKQKKPWALINAAGFVRVDDAENDAGSCHRDNVQGAHNLAKACAASGIQLVSFSSDLVFDGKKSEAYLESDATCPINVYGRTKAESEILISKEHPDALIIRTSAFFSNWDEYNFVHFVRRNLEDNLPFSAANDLYISPTYVPDLVHASLDLLIDREKGIWHLANRGALTWSDLAMNVAQRFGLDSSLIEARPASELGFIASRPAYSVLGSERGHLLPGLEDALDRYVLGSKEGKLEVA